MNTHKKNPSVRVAVGGGSAISRAAMALSLLVLSATAAAGTASFTTTYQGGSDASCGTSYTIVGSEPADGAKHPVFIYTVGTGETYTNASALAAVTGMAARGYVAATIEYPSGTFGDCTTLSARSQCIFDSGNAQSAASVLCSRATADCSKGIVTGGFSQGSIMATLAHNYNSGVQAAYGIGDGVRYSGYNLKSCMAAGNYSLPTDRLRVINGVHDDFLGPTSKGAYSQTRTVTGLDCPNGTTACFRPNGSGWYVIQNNEVEDGYADHCYMRVGGCLTSEDVLDTGWASGSAAWELNANLDWLTGFTQH